MFSSRCKEVGNQQPLPTAFFDLCFSVSNPSAWSSISSVLCWTYIHNTYLYIYIDRYRYRHRHRHTHAENGWFWDVFLYIHSWAVELSPAANTSPSKLTTWASGISPPARASTRISNQHLSCVQTAAEVCLNCVLDSVFTYSWCVSPPTTSKKCAKISTDRRGMFQRY